MMLLRRRGASSHKFGVSFPAGTFGTALSAAKAGTSKAKVLYLGDSIFEGEGASTTLNRATAKLITGIRSKYGISGSAPGMIGCYHDTQLSDSSSWRNPLSASNSLVSNGWFSTQGWRGADLNSAGTYAQWTVTCDSFDVVHLTGTNDGGSLSVSVDGGTATVINTSAGTFAVGVVTHINIGTLASHTIKVTLTAGGGALDGIVPYVGDYTAGLQWWDATHFGFNSNDYGSSDALDTIVAAMSNFAPHLVVDNITGTADYSQNATTPTAMVTNLNARIAKYKAITPVPIVLFVGTYQIGSQLTTANSLGYTMQQYFDAAKTAVQSAGLTWLNLNDVYPTFQSQSGWLASDGGHPSDTGHQKIADAMLTAIS